MDEKYHVEGRIEQLQKWVRQDEQRLMLLRMDGIDRRMPEEVRDLEQRIQNMRQGIEEYRQKLRELEA